MIEKIKEFLAESRENFKENVLGMKTDIPGEEGISPEVIRIWLVYLVDILVGFFGALLSYSYVGGVYWNQIRSGKVATLLAGMVLIFHFFVALFVSALIGLILAVVMRVILLREMSEDVNVFGVGMALFLLVYVVVTILLYMFKVPTPYLFA